MDAVRIAEYGDHVHLLSLRPPLVFSRLQGLIESRHWQVRPLDWHVGAPVDLSIIKKARNYSVDYGPSDAWSIYNCSNANTAFERAVDFERFINGEFV